MLMFDKGQQQQQISMAGCSGWAVGAQAVSLDVNLGQNAHGFTRENFIAQGQDGVISIYCCQDN